MIVSSLTSLFTLQSCYACGEPLTVQEKFVCFHCLGQIPLTDFHLKPCDNELYYRLAGKVPLAGAMSLFYFDKAGKLQQLISQIKYKNALPLATYLGEYYGHFVGGARQFPAEAVLVPVPLHWRKRFNRGYNQAEILAKGLSRSLNLPLGTTYLRRSRFTPSQTRLSGTARWDNVSRAFHNRREPPGNIVLVDDVITTGATLEACIRALYEADNPPDKVWVMALGTARKQ